MFIHYKTMVNLFILILSILMDILWGELPTSIHPVVLMGKAISFFKVPLITWNSKLSGLVLTIIIITIFIVTSYLTLLIASSSVILFILVSTLLLSATFAIKSLYQSACQVQNVLEDNVEKARVLVSLLVSRETENLSKNELASATVESLTENINDSVTAPIFYVLFIGALVMLLCAYFNINPQYSPHNVKWLWEIKNPLTISKYSFTLLTLPILAGVFYRVVNTLDAMVGYKTSEYRMIGYFPAKLDDVLNFLPARFTGVLVVIAAAINGLDWRNSWKTMRKEASKTSSPNSGFTMAAAAGALNVQLEKPSAYKLGKFGYDLDGYIIKKAILLTKITIILFLILSFTMYFILYLIVTRV